MDDHLHPPEENAAPPPGAMDRPVDAGSQALSEALRSSFGIVKFVMFILVCVFLGSGLFTVGPQERAIIIRLGKPVGQGEKALLGPGLHLAFPYPIDEYRKVPITAIQQVRSTVAWYATTLEQEQAGTEVEALPTGTPLNPLVDGSALTADKNIIHARATLTYHISDPIAFVFNFVNASNLVQSALDDALLATAASYNVDDLLTRDRAGFKDAVLKRVTTLVEDQKLGITVEQCVVDSRPPRQLKEGFQSVLDAEVKRGKALNTARGYENEVLSKAGADAQARTNAAEADRVRMVREAASQADRFLELLPKYEANPQLFKQQRQAEVLARVFTNAQNKIYVASKEGKEKEFRLQLNQEGPKQKAEESTKPQ